MTITVSGAALTSASGVSGVKAPSMPRPSAASTPPSRSISEEAPDSGPAIMATVVPRR